MGLDSGKGLGFRIWRFREGFLDSGFGLWGLGARKPDEESKSMGRIRALTAALL